MSAVADRMLPFEAAGEYYVPIVDNYIELGGYDTDAWPTWFKNFHTYCSSLAVDYGQVPISVMNRELGQVGGRLVQFDTQDGWMMVWRSEQDYLMFVLRWS
jgi:hypothetical protein